jgi:hypothetical protein
VLGLPPAFVLSQDQTLKLNENLAPAGHYLHDESQAHLLANHRFANLVNLSYVTARVSHRPQTLYGYIMDTVRKDSAVHVSLSSYLIVKQQSLVKQNSLLNLTTRLRPAPMRPLPGFFHRVVLGPRNSRERVGAARPRRRWTHCRAYRSTRLPLSIGVFKKTSKKLRHGCPVAPNFPSSPVTSSSHFLQSLDCPLNDLCGGHSVFRPSLRQQTSRAGD